MQIGDLSNKVVLVTGSTSGIGQAIAQAAVAAGAKVMLHGRDADRASAIVDALGDSAAYHLADLRKVADLHALVDATVAKFGKIDCLVNNAGIYPRDDVETLSEDFFDNVFAINTKAPLFLAQAAIKAFKKQQTGGCILNIGSINAYAGESEMTVYPMTKGALMTMTRNLSERYCYDGIRVNQLNLGWILTQTESERMVEQGYPQDWEKQIESCYAPSGKLLRPEECAQHALFWLSDAAGPVSGQVYEVEQYPVIGRNMINLMRPRCISKTEKS
jgi:NAD(P)-dependent dehydrogenase (short-subunit alcohol dehydrogenase family)